MTWPGAEPPQLGRDDWGIGTIVWNYKGLDGKQGHVLTHTVVCDPSGDYYCGYCGQRAGCYPHDDWTCECGEVDTNDHHTIWLGEMVA